jgi:hypothetical protein
VADVSIHVEGGTLRATTGWLRRAAVVTGHALTWPFRWLEAHPVKGSLFGGYLAALYLVMRHGVFYDRERLFPWLFVGVAILALGTDWRRLLELVVYWVPFFLLARLEGECVLSALARKVASIEITGPIDAEKTLFPGKIPSNVLQDRLYDPRHIPWWAVITGLTYMSHFFVVYVTAAVLFLRSRDRFVRWMTALVVLTVFGLLGYWLFPMAPPWMAANELHLIPDLARPAPRPAPPAPDLRRPAVDARRNNSEMVNPVAAMPSLHAGYSMLFTWFFFKRTRRVWAKALLALYPWSWPSHWCSAASTT